MATEELVALEERAWEALSTEGAASAFYEQVLDDDVVVVLPGGMLLTDRDQIIASMEGPPWSSYEIEAPQVARPTRDTGVVTYGVRACRGDTDYSALMSSLYVRRGDDWKLTFHQQTPR